MSPAETVATARSWFALVPRFGLGTTAKLAVCAIPGVKDRTVSTNEIASANTALRWIGVISYLLRPCLYPTVSVALRRPNGVRGRRAHLARGVVIIMSRGDPLHGCRAETFFRWWRGNRRGAGKYFSAIQRG